MKQDCHPSASVYQVYEFLTGWVEIDLFKIRNGENTTLSGCVVYAGERYVAIYTPGEATKTRVVATDLVREIRPIPLGG